MRTPTFLERLVFAGCLTVVASATEARAQTRFEVHIIIANKTKYNPEILDPTLVNAWGLAIRPAGFGGHFWVANYGNGTSDEYVGDVRSTPLVKDDLKIGTVPNAVPDEAGPTGVVFNQFPGYLGDANGRPIAIPGLLAILPGNGASLGEAFRLYFAAGPDEVDGWFGYVELLVASTGSLRR